MDYSAEVRRRFASLERAGEFPPGTPGVVRGEAEDRALNVWIRFEVQVLEGVIRSVRYQVYGCPHAAAAASSAAEWLEGQPAEALGRLDVQALRVALDVPIEKLGKLLLIEDALSACRQALEGDGEEKGS